MKTHILLILIILSVSVPAQELDIVPYLKAIEEGKKESVISEISSLKQRYNSDPSFIFLEGILMDNAEEAVLKYNSILDKYPASKYADAALYRIYSYYFAMGLYNAADNHLRRLKQQYSESPYIRIAERNIPSENDPLIYLPPEPKDVKEIRSESNYKYTIQAGAFSNKKNSEHLANEFRASGYSTEIKEKLVGGTTFLVVYVGKFNTEREAANFLKIINDRYSLDGRVIKTDAE